MNSCIIFVLLVFSFVLSQSYPIMEGDLLMTDEMFRAIYGEEAFERMKGKKRDKRKDGRKLALLNLTQYYWSDRDNENKIIVPWTFKSGDFTTLQREEIESFLVVMEEKLGVFSFVQRTNEVDYVEIVNDASYCASYIGKQGGKQELLLQDDCIYRGIVEHEMMHVLGVFHEHTRYDRDEYVTILSSNIMEGYETNFLRRSSEHTDDLGVGYDYDSVMHYGPYDFSIEYGHLKTIESYGHVIGQREQMSSRDIEQLRLMYKCTDGPRHKSEFCTFDCLCMDGEGMCVDDSGCYGTLACNNGVCGTPRPTSSPITYAPTTIRPTKSPTVALTAQKKGTWWYDANGKLRIANVAGVAVLCLTIVMLITWCYYRDTSVGYENMKEDILF